MKKVLINSHGGNRRFTPEQIEGKTEDQLTEMKQEATATRKPYEDNPRYTERCDVCGIEIHEDEGDNMEAHLCIACDID